MLRLKFRYTTILALFFSVSTMAYLPGENSFVTLPNSNGIFGNPALLPAFDSPGAIVSYEKENGIHDFRTGFNISSFGWGFEYLSNGEAIDETRWSMTHGFDLWDRALFIGQRVEAFRSADFGGTAWDYSPGILFRPFQYVALGYTSHNLLQIGSDYQKRNQEFGATFRPISSLSVSWNTLNFETHRLLVSADLYLFNIGFQIPLVGDEEEYKLTLSRSFGAYNDLATTFYDDYRPHSVAWGFHSARNPNVSLLSHVVRVPLNVPIRETEEGFSLLGSNTMGLETVRNHLNLLLADKSASLIILDFSGYRAGTAASKEIQRGIQRLQKDGRRVVAYLDEVRPSVMLAASAADRIVLEPSARVTYRGIAGEVLYYKGFFDWIGVDVQLLRHGAYKSAVEPYTADSMSVEARSNMENLYKKWWVALTEDIYARKGNAGALDSFVNNPKLTSKEAQRVGLVDTVLYLDQVTPFALKEFYGVEAPFAIASTWAPKEDVKLFNEDWRTRGHIALLNIEGTIVEGEGGFDPLSMQRSTGSSEILEILDEIRNDPKYDALVVRINSPGGGAQASDVIWHRLRSLSESGLPIVASIGDVGASGGYYIACAADRILAEKASIVGSIGIFGGKVNLSSLFSKLKIRTETVKTHEHADAEGQARGFTDGERQALQAYMDDFYERFLNVVSRATNIPHDKLDSELAGGRVFTGSEAVASGMIHQIGGMDAAIDEAKKLAGIRASKPVEVVSLLADRSYLARSFKDQTRLFQWVKTVEKTQVWALDPISFLDVE